MPEAERRPDQEFTKIGLASACAGAARQLLEATQAAETPEGVAAEVANQIPALVEGLTAGAKRLLQNTDMPPNAPSTHLRLPEGFVPSHAEAETITDAMLDYGNRMRATS